MTTRAFTQVVATVVVAVFALGIWVSGDEVDSNWLRYYSVAVFAAVAVLTLWEHRLWRVRLLQRFDFVPPVMRGTWRGKLISTWVDPGTGRPLPPKTVYLVVRQTFGKVTVGLLTDESRSQSTVATVRRSGGQASLDYVYVNTPRLLVEHRSRMHHGSASLAAVGAPATRLYGRYWTDRDTKGELDMTEQQPGLAGDFEEAEVMFRGGRSP